MKFFIKIILFIFLFTVLKVNAEYLYILNDRCIKELYQEAQTHVKSNEIEIHKSSRGIYLRFNLDNPISESIELSTQTVKYLKILEYFLAKIENPAIIEVHTVKFQKNNSNTLKNWEISTIIANKIEAFLLTFNKNIDANRIKSVGYGEFLPAKNTPNNGGNSFGRVDIIILCNISGE